MQYNPKIHNRRSIRLKGYDYSQKGLYFVTIVCQNRQRFFGQINEDEMRLNEAGKMIENEWQKIPERFENVQLNEYIIMPNHFHAIIAITEQEQPQGISTTVGDIVGAFKSITTNEYIKKVKSNHWEHFNKRLWQRNFWEHIIRDEKSDQEISKYIISNPQNWINDSLY